VRKVRRDRPGVVSFIEVSFEVGRALEARFGSRRRCRGVVWCRAAGRGPVSP
jgi:hypothetical protein